MLDFGFYLMDCLDGMREFPNNYFDLAIVDPPYGIGYDIKAMQSAGQKSKNGAAYKKEYHASNWDDKIPTKSYFDELFRVSKHQMILLKSVNVWAESTDMQTNLSIGINPRRIRNDKRRSNNSIKGVIR